jgi:hypothetical protein
MEQRLPPQQKEVAMTPRNPDERPEEDPRDKDPQAVHDEHAHASGEQTSPSASDLASSLEEAPETKVEIDRLALYLKGPTAFTA